MKEKSTEDKSKRGLVLRLGIGAGCFLLAAGLGFYGWKTYYYRDKFYQGTVINQIECGEMNVEQVENLIREQVETYSLQIQFRNDVTENIAGNDIDYQYVSDGSVEKVKKSQSPFLWFTGLFKEHTYEVNENITFDEEKLSRKVEALDSMKESAQKEPENAYVTFQGKAFTIVEEVYGTKLKEETLLKAVKDAVHNSREELSAETAGAYVMPEFTRDSEKIVKEKEQLNELVKASITYELPEGEKVLDGNELKKWLKIDKEGNYVKDKKKFKKKIKEYVEKLAEKVDTLGKERPFHTTSGRDVTVKGGRYGWQINQEKECKKLEENIKKKQIVSRKPVYSSEEKYKTNHGLGDTYIEVNLTEQHLYYYVDGEVAVESPLVSGTMVRSRFTPPGVYFLSYKARNQVLRGEKLPDGTYSYESPVAYWMPFNGGIGLHDASWRGSFGGTIYRYRGSHGCINLPHSKAQRIYELIDKDTPIVCVYNDGYSLYG